MFEHIDPRSATPLYAQIADRVRVAIAAGHLRPADALPSVRQLAGELRVNPATVVQAYRDLETSGFVETREREGTFVRELAPERRARERARHATSLVRRLLADAARLGVAVQDLQAAITEEIGAPTP
ncbi:MAG: GntR family transcriptional regulator [Gemmatimonadales bacterium]